MQHLFDTAFDPEVECIKAHGVNHCWHNHTLHYQHYFQHDNNMVFFLKLFRMNLNYKYVLYATTVIFELHVDE